MTVSVSRSVPPVPPSSYRLNRQSEATRHAHCTSFGLGYRGKIRAIIQRTDMKEPVPEHRAALYLAGDQAGFESSAGLFVRFVTPLPSACIT